MEQEKQEFEQLRQEMGEVSLKEMSAACPSHSTLREFLKLFLQSHDVIALMMITGLVSHRI